MRLVVLMVMVMVMVMCLSQGTAQGLTGDALRDVDQLLSVQEEAMEAELHRPLMLPEDREEVGRVGEGAGLLLRSNSLIEMVPATIVHTGERNPVHVVQAEDEEEGAGSVTVLPGTRVGTTHQITDWSKRLVRPHEWVRAKIEKDMPVPTADYSQPDPELAVARIEAEKAAEEVGTHKYDASYLREHARPSDHLLQETLAGIRSVEASDIGGILSNTLPANLAKPAEGTAVTSSESSSGGDGDESSGPGLAEQVGHVSRTDAAQALVKVGAVAEKLADRVAKLDGQATRLMARLYGEGRKADVTAEAQERDAEARERNTKREFEVAQLVRREVRSVTDKMRTELEMLKGNFFNEVRESLRSVRQELHSEFLRSQESEKRLLMHVQNKDATHQQDMLDEALSLPMEEEARVVELIKRHTNTAFEKAQKIAAKVTATAATTGDRAKDAVDVENDEKRAKEAEADAAPKREEVRAAVEKAAAVRRAADEEALEDRLSDALVAESHEATEAAEEEAEEEAEVENEAHQRMENAETDAKAESERDSESTANDDSKQEQ